MGRELYQLVAISNNGMEYIIELKNENANNKGTLDSLDYGTTRFSDEQHLAQYLVANGKIPNTNVKFAIRYTHNGFRYIPVIFDDKRLRFVAKNIENSDIYADYAFCLLKEVEVALSDSGFYYYLVNLNNKNIKQNASGNYLNKKLIDSIHEYFNAYVKNHNVEADKTELQYSILNELYNYKQLRTLHMFYHEYQKMKNKEYNAVNESNLTPEERIVSNMQTPENMPDIPDEIASAYREGGYEEVYNTFSLDELEERGIGGRFR